MRFIWQTALRNAFWNVNYRKSLKHTCLDTAFRISSCMNVAKLVFLRTKVPITPETLLNAFVGDPFRIISKINVAKRVSFLNYFGTRSKKEMRFASLPKIQVAKRIFCDCNSFRSVLYRKRHETRWKKDAFCIISKTWRLRNALRSNKTQRNAFFSRKNDAECVFGLRNAFRSAFPLNF